ncbi:MAG: folate family ECF transporter S component [Firmicutes bacterium]|nr:folate family ECF transporter S component [Bacillota bacterium]
MSKIGNSSLKQLYLAPFSTYSLVCCGLLAALSVVFARLLGFMPSQASRYSIEAVPIILSGMLFGPIPGAMVGFAADAVGCLFSGYGYNPIFAVAPILYGLVAGLLRPMLVRRLNLFTIALSILPSVLLGSILYQSLALTWMYNTADAFWPAFTARLASRSIQFGITGALDIAVIWLLFRAKVFQRTKLWPPVC